MLGQAVDVAAPEKKLPRGDLSPPPPQARKIRGSPSVTALHQPFTHPHLAIETRQASSTLLSLRE